MDKIQILVKPRISFRGHGFRLDIFEIYAFVSAQWVKLFLERYESDYR